MATSAKQATTKAQPKRRMRAAKPVTKAKPVAKSASAALPSKADLEKAQNFFDGLSKKANAAKAAKTKGKPAAKGKTVAAKAEKPKKVLVPFQPRKLAKGAHPFAIATDARPQSGSRLFAHTHAALTMLGLLDEGRPTVPEKALLSIIGQRAVSYHEKAGNFERTKDHGMRLTVSGANTFRNRLTDGKVDGGLANDFLTLLLDGKVKESTGVQPGKVYHIPL